MRKLNLFILLSVLAIEVMAVPAKRVVKTITQSDGTQLDVMLRGDESFHFYSTTDGIPLIETPDGYAYAKVENGILTSTGMRAHNLRDRMINETSYVEFGGAANRVTVHQLWSQKNASRNAHRLLRSAMKKRQDESKKVKSRASATETVKKGLVILVNFSDDNKLQYGKSDFNEMFNTTGYNKNRHIGSVRDYFKDQSYGQLEIDFDVVGPYQLSNKMSYYGENDSKGDDKHAGQMAAEACQLANADVNYSDYDWDGDGEVDQVYIIYAGYGEATTGAPKNTVWPHEWTLTSSDYGKSLKLDNVIVDTYACSNELSGTSGSVMDGIGTACHEFSHCLGLPDLYDTSEKCFGMATWSIMDYGCYNGPWGYEGCVPCAYTAYERFFAGWVEPTELHDGCIVNGMKAITESEDCYIIYNDKVKDEYYLLTNIQKKSWNTYAEGHGLLVMHVDYDESAWFENAVNVNENRQRCTIIAADDDMPPLDSSTWDSLEGDPYPGKSENTSLTNESTPAAILYNANLDGKYYMNKPIEAITENSDGTISFVFNGGPQLGVPEVLEATDITPTSFTANWTKVEEATSYTVELFETYEAEVTLMLSEDFSKLKSSGVNTSLDISPNLDKYMTLTGWTGAKLFPGGNNGIKFGSSAYSGNLTTPTLDAPATGTITLYLKSYPYGKSTSAEFDVTIGSSTQRVESDGSDKVIVFNNVENDFNIQIGTTTNMKRAYIGEIRVYDGEITLDDITSGSSKARRIQAKRSIQKVENVEDTHYTFTNLASGSYYYRVQAVKAATPAEAARVSSWSSQILVELASSRPSNGDVNEDGAVDISDIVAVINQIAGTQTYRYADVNSDKKVDISDIVAIINIIANKE